MARHFQSAHPDDARLGALLAEVATLFDLQPQTKETILLDAQRLTADDELKARIADDLRRCALVGKTVPFNFKPAGTAGIDLRNYRGKVVLLIFFAGWSPPALEALDALQRAAVELPKGRVQFVGVSLDTKRERLVALAREKKITWPVACDGRGWESLAGATARNQRGADGLVARSGGSSAFPQCARRDRRAGPRAAAREVEIPRDQQSWSCA